MLNTDTLARFGQAQDFQTFSLFHDGAVVSDGVQYVASHAGRRGAFWLIDAIAGHQADAIAADPEAAQSQCWRLTVDAGRAVLYCQIRRENLPIIEIEIPETDFDLDHFAVWVIYSADGHPRLMLPSEY